MKLKPEVKAAWVTALRSGEYKQGTGCLNKLIDGEEHYCCLGVLADLAARQGIVERFVPDDGFDGDPFRNYDGEAGLPPLAVWSWAAADKISTSFSPAGPRVQIDQDGEEFWSGLSSLNDTDGWTFDQIADVIEEQF